MRPTQWVMGSTPSKKKRPLALKLGLYAALASGSRKREMRAIDTAVIVPAGFPCCQSYRPISP